MASGICILDKWSTFSYNMYNPKKNPILLLYNMKLTVINEWICYTLNLQIMDFVTRQTYIGLALVLGLQAIVIHVEHSESRWTLINPQFSHRPAHPGIFGVNWPNSHVVLLFRKI